MAETHVISALTAKRSELAGLVAFHSKELARLSEEVKALDAAIKLFEPSYRIQGIKVKRYQRKNEFFKSGESHIMSLDIIRTAEKPISTLAIAEEARRRKGLQLDHDQLLAFRASISTTLSRQKASGLISEVRKDKGTSIWVIA
jgi:hypothetical protein